MPMWEPCVLTSAMSGLIFKSNESGWPIPPDTHKYRNREGEWSNKIDSTNLRPQEQRLWSFSLILSDDG
jgi:hypothetical protein